MVIKHTCRNIAKKMCNTYIENLKIFNNAEVQSLREKCREFEQQQEKVKKAQNEVESSMNTSINNLQSELESRKAKIAKVICSRV